MMPENCWVCAGANADQYIRRALFRRSGSDSGGEPRHGGLPPFRLAPNISSRGQIWAGVVN